MVSFAYMTTKRKAAGPSPDPAPGMAALAMVPQRLTMADR
jgi:hypothetical protein